MGIPLWRMGKKEAERERETKKGRERERNKRKWRVHLLRFVLPQFILTLLMLILLEILLARTPGLIQGVIC